MDKYKAIVAFGPPGAGKGTAFQRAKEHAWVHYIASGDVVREAQAKGDRFAKEITSYLSKGKLIPDGDLVRIVKESLEKRVEDKLYVPSKQLLLCDGFPRTAWQLDQFDKFISVEEVLLFDAGVHVLDERRKDRIKEYENSGKKPRTDDTLEAFANRVKDYLITGNACLDEFAKRGILITKIDANKSKDEVYLQAARPLCRKAYRFGLA